MLSFLFIFKYNIDFVSLYILKQYFTGKIHCNCRKHTVILQNFTLIFYKKTDQKNVILLYISGKFLFYRGLFYSLLLKYVSKTVKLQNTNANSQEK